LEGSLPVPDFAREAILLHRMDADVTIFDPSTVQEQAAYADPDQRSAGIPFVIVNGVPAIDHGVGVESAAPGRWLGRKREQ
jgi:N-acyl-D-aspartate/D-glutamate deacylase